MMATKSVSIIQFLRISVMLKVVIKLYYKLLLMHLEFITNVQTPGVIFLIIQTYTNIVLYHTAEI